MSDDAQLVSQPPEPPNGPQWFIRRGDQKVGPYTRDQISHMARAGTIAPTDLLWTEGRTDWTHAGNFQGLFPYTTTGPAPYQVGAGNIEHKPGMEWVLPVKTSVWAIIAGYCGLLSVLFIFAPLAVIFGLVALYDIRTHPGLHGLGRAIFGIVMGLIFSGLSAFFIIAMILGA